MGLSEALQAALASSYHIERELGRGGMATVYLARDLKHDRLVALKVLHPDLATNLGPERFAREIKLAARLQHPHILTVLESGEAAGQLWYTMPYVEGESLRERLRRERQLSVEESVRIGYETALALEYAHRHGVVHRDIKPENLLLTGDGSVLVADFGIARALESGAAEANLTGTGISVGTPAYMSPEQATGAREIDARTDIYSLGAVLYEMLAGEPPFTGPTPQAVIARRFTDMPRALRIVRDNVPEGVEAAVSKALAKLPADRFATAAELGRALFLVSTRSPISPAGSTSRARGRRWIPVGLATLGLGFLLGLGVLFAWRRSRPTGTNPAEGGGRKMLVVLPFENLGTSQDEYFADGLTEAISTRLGSLNHLGIIARQSAMQYKRTTKNPREIGRELGVQYILTGTVRWDRSAGGTSRVRVSPQLIAVADQRQLWAEQYDTTLASVFEVESHLAKQVASALDLALAVPGRSLGDAPTRNLEAYDAYLRGREVENRGFDAGNFLEAARMYERAVALDSTFAAAFAQLSITHTQMYWLYVDRSASRLARAKEAANRAQQLAPDLPETHLALANYYYRSALDYDRALGELDALERVRPGDTDLARWRGFIRRRQGRWDDALSQLQYAERLDPRSPAGIGDVGDTYLFLRRYDDALRAYDAALELNPGSSGFALQKAIAYVGKSGDREGMQRLVPDVRRGTAPAGGPSGIIGYADIVPLLNREQQAQLLRLKPDAFLGDTAGLALAQASVYRAWGQPAPARRAFEAARSSLERRLSLRPDDHIFLAEHSLALAGLGRTDEAVQQATRALDARPLARDHLEGSLLVANLARIYTMASRPDDAIDQLQTVLSKPGPLSPNWLKADPFWAPLKANPRFTQLVDGS